MTLWRHVLRTVFPATLILATTAVALQGQTAEETMIDAAIARGIANVWQHQGPDGRWGQYDWAGGHHYPWGRDAIALLTLEFADVAVDDERYQKGLKLFLEADLSQNYERSCRTMVLAHLVRRTKGDRKTGYRKALKRDVRWLEKAQGEHGGWTYVSLGGGPGTHDFSNSQMSVLALSEAILSGVEVSRKVMQKAQDLFLEAQRADGGWNYRLGETRNESYGSMTAAAVATLFITRDYLHPQVGCPCRGGRSSRRSTGADKAITAGVAWLAKNFEPNRNPSYRSGWWARYWLYSVARVGVATGFRFLGQHDWYRAGTPFAVASVGLGGKNFPFGCLATLFLIKGKAPILYNKLQWDGPWNLHPRDLANLTRRITRLKEQPVGWQVMPVAVPLEEWHTAPILYISTEEKIDFTDLEKAKLKRFTETGGTIFFEATCGNRTARAWWETLCRELWPEYEFKALGETHPLWTADLEIPRGRRPILRGLSDSLRTFVFLAPRDISCTWNSVANRRYEGNFRAVSNLYAYATDRQPIRRRLASGRAAADPFAGTAVTGGTKAQLQIARLKTSGDYYAGRRYTPLATFNDLRDSGAPQLVIADPVGAEGLDPALVDVAWLTGRQSAKLSDAMAKALGAYLTKGGFLLAEATLGDARFAASFDETARVLGLTVKALADTHPVLTGRFSGGAGGYATTKVRFTSHLKTQRLGRPAPLLYGLYLGDRLVGVYSRYDVMFSQTGLKAFGNLGYAARDARAIVTNILLQASVNN